PADTRPATSLQSDGSQKSLSEGCCVMLTRQSSYRRRQAQNSLRVPGPRGILVELRGKRCQRASRGRPLRAGEHRPRGADAVSGEALRALELIDVRARHREARGPGEALLILDVLVRHFHQLRGVELVLRE